jgi:hypothetical protein
MAWCRFPTGTVGLQKLSWEEKGMTPLLLLLGLLMSEPADRPMTLRYLKPQGGKYVLESEVTTRTTPAGSTYSSRTVRGDETLTLTIQRDKKDQIIRAEITDQKKDRLRTAQLELRGRVPQVKRGGITELIKPPADPVVTTAPDWSDIFELVRRYDTRKGGKQEFAGLWFHPNRRHQVLTFGIEKVGKDGVTVNGTEQQLDRYAIKLRSGNYRVWARSDGRVVKILPSGEKAVPVVLEGYETAAKGLR